ncbi:MAG TPA: DUF4870 domain-containing protein, partial [Spirochaetota bacterium]|nr:DUF4870 domain-containing protein [Spirochaetota bacterium]
MPSDKIVTDLNNNDKTTAMFCHLSSLSVFLGVPFGNIIFPLVIWLLKKNESAFVDYNGKQVLNFQLSMLIYTVAAGILCFIIIGFVALFAILILEIVFTVIGSVK